MIGTHTKGIDHYFGALVTLALLLAVMASLLLTQAAKPAHASTTFTVNSTADASDTNHNDDTCDANLSNVPVCTLRAAIEQANATPGADAINFDISGTSVQTIHVNASGYGELPDITAPVTINGYTQRPCTTDPAPCSSPNTLAKGTNAKLMIELDGSKVTGESFGLHITAPDVTVKGLVINRFVGGGIFVWKGNDTKIEGNFVGTDPSGTKAWGNLEGGVGIGQSSNVTVGGPSPASRNLISGNGDSPYHGGITILGDGNGVYGNLIGTQRDGKSPLGNVASGVDIFSTDYQSASQNIVGGTAPGYANTIAFNGGDGVRIHYVSGPASHIASYNSVLSNSIFSNGGLGIDLGDDGVTLNDAADADFGPNFRQNYPVLSSAKKSAAGKTTIKGKLNSSPTTSVTVQFFSNPSGTNEGKTLLFSGTVTTDGTGNADFAFSTTKKVSLGQNITATATDSTGNTSEFSAPKKVVAS